MAESANPYRHDVPGLGPFVGRAQELGVLEQALVAGRNALAAVMGGRGMGKTSLLRKLRQRLDTHGALRVLVLDKVAQDPGSFVRQLGRRLEHELAPPFVVDDLCRAVDACSPVRTVLLLDEVDGLIGAEGGHEVLENLRVAYERLAGALGVVVFGGSRLRQLLTSEVSPFLRTARWIRLVGLSRGETATLVNEPLGLELSEPVIETLWEQTGGHPLLLQALMESAVEQGEPVVRHLPGAIERLRADLLEPRLFPIWWDNLTAAGQRAYRTLVGMDRPVPRDQWARHLGDDPDAVVEILESTGLARVEAGDLFARSALFAAWLERTHPGRDEPFVGSGGLTAEFGALYDRLGIDDFERLVVEALGRWARHVMEHPTPYLRTSTRGGNDSLVPEQIFQLGLVGALRQHDLVAEPEALSSLRGRVDIKVRPWAAPQHRTCVELKIWGRNDYKEVVDQLMEYCTPQDDFGCVVMLDRGERPLRAAYEAHCLDSEAEVTWSRQADRAAPLTMVTEHRRPAGRCLRIHHFLVQLPR